MDAGRAESEASRLGRRACELLPTHACTGSAPQRVPERQKGLRIRSVLAELGWHAPNAARDSYRGGAKNTRHPPPFPKARLCAPKTAAVPSACMSNVSQIAGVSTVPVKIYRAGRSWVRCHHATRSACASY